ncbi:MAG: hypothetical protein QME76_10035 [Bacillota bacterium]|nr:hypothetical protein [Bacillota bacterium]
MTLETAGILFRTARGVPFDQLLFPDFPAGPVDFEIVARVRGFAADRAYNLFYFFRPPGGELGESPHFICRPPHPPERVLIVSCPSFTFPRPGIYTFALYAGPRRLATAQLRASPQKP